MSRGIRITIVVLVALVMVGLIILPGLRQKVQRMSQPPKTEEQARREVMQVPISTPTDVKVKAQMFWLAPGSESSLQATTIEIPLSADPVERSKQLLNALIANVPAPELRTLPADTTLLAFYIQPDGTGIADFSDELSSGMPSGILSEQLAVDSMTQTLGANMTGIQRLKILIHGQEADTLAGHLDLSGLFSVPTPAPAPAPASTATPASAPAAAPAASPAKPAATGSGAPKPAAASPASHVP